MLGPMRAEAVLLFALLCTWIGVCLYANSKVTDGKAFEEHKVWIVISLIALPMSYLGIRFLVHFRPRLRTFGDHMWYFAVLFAALAFLVGALWLPYELYSPVRY